MTADTVSSYYATISGGPGDALVAVHVMYYADGEVLLGSHADNAMAFGYTWKDVARVVAEGILALGLRCDAHVDLGHVSPHVDLT